MLSHSITREEAYECVGPGWERLINDAYNIMDRYNGIVTIDQVKEKFGGLRIYISWHIDDDWEADADLDTLVECLRVIEDVSHHVCEECGNLGINQRIKGWYYTLCDECTKNIK